MAKFKVYVHQYVEMLAVIEVEADDQHDASDHALRDLSLAEWSAGDDAYKARVYQVDDAAGTVVFEG